MTVQINTISKKTISHREYLEKRFSKEEIDKIDREAERDVEMYLKQIQFMNEIKEDVLLTQIRKYFGLRR